MSGYTQLLEFINGLNITKPEKETLRQMIKSISSDKKTHRLGFRVNKLINDILKSLVKESSLNKREFVLNLIRSGMHLDSSMDLFMSHILSKAKKSKQLTKHFKSQNIDIATLNMDKIIEKYEVKEKASNITSISVSEETHAMIKSYSSMFEISVHKMFMMGFVIANVIESSIEDGSINDIIKMFTDLGNICVEDHTKSYHPESEEFKFSVWLHSIAMIIDENVKEYKSSKIDLSETAFRIARWIDIESDRVGFGKLTYKSKDD